MFLYGSHLLTFVFCQRERESVILVMIRPGNRVERKTAEREGWGRKEVGKRRTTEDALNI